MNHLKSRLLKTLHPIKLLFVRFPHVILAGIFVVITMAVFFTHGGFGGMTPRSDYFFMGELMALSAVCIILLLAIAVLPDRKIIFPWVGALVAVAIIMLYTLYTYDQKIGTVLQLRDLYTSFVSYAEGSLNFFGLFHWAQGGLSAIPPMIDIHIAMATGFSIGAVIGRKVSKRTHSV